MTNCINQHGQPIGPALPEWKGAAHPGHGSMTGKYASLEALNSEAHTEDLFHAYRKDESGAIWTYNFIGPFEHKEDLQAWIEKNQNVDEQPYFAIIDQTTGKASGIASFMRIQSEHGVIEIGGITFSPCLQRTRASTEAIYLMMRRALGELGYRRLEWKCDALNVPSRTAALRFGYNYDGLFKQAVTYKGRNRDTTWYSLLDCNWPSVGRAFRTWLAADNFDEMGQQKRKLADLLASE